MSSEKDHRAASYGVVVQVAHRTVLIQERGQSHSAAPSVSSELFTFMLYSTRTLQVQWDLLWILLLTFVKIIFPHFVINLKIQTCQQISRPAPIHPAPPRSNDFTRLRARFPPPHRVVSSGKRLYPGLVNCVTALVYHSCLGLSSAFTQPGDHLLAKPRRII